jgi:CheY-like chemotaxis protein
MPTKGSVLVVDDNTDSRELIAEYLRIVGFHVIEASNGADAVTSAEVHKPSVVLMDLSMPGLIDGWEATRMIKRRPFGRAPVVMAVTAHAFPAYHEMARYAGCQGVFVKPIDVEELARVVEQVIAPRLPAAS